MGMVVRSNIMAMNANRQLGVNNSTLSKSLEKLASGFKINRAGDDASGLAISEKMKAQIKGLEVAAANAQDGISLVQTAEGALTEVHDMLNRMVELVDKSANGTIQDKVDRDAIQSEVEALNAEIDRISQSTNFNGINLLDGSMGTGTSGGTATSGAATGLAAGAIDFTVAGKDGITVKFAAATGDTATTAAWGASSTLTITIGAGASAKTISQADIDKAIASATGAPDIAKGLKVTLNKDIVTNGTATAAGDVTGASVLTESAKKASVTVNGVTVTANKAGARDAAKTFQVTSSGTDAVGATVKADGTIVVNLSATESYSAADINKMLTKAGADVTVSFEGAKTAAQVGFGTADTLDNGAGLAAGGGLDLQIGDTADSFNSVQVKVEDMSAASLGVSTVDASTADGAKAAIQTIKDAINKVSTNRGNLGALQNRLEHTINNLDVTAENMSAANSRIRDTDMAKEMMNYTKMNVLTQAAQAMLAQANQQPQSILQLLQ